MAGQTIDYDALAAQNGATAAPASGGGVGAPQTPAAAAGGRGGTGDQPAAAVDYDALAKQNGAIDSPHNWLDSVADYARGVWSGINPVSAAKGAVQAASHPLDTGKRMLQDQGALADKAKAAFQSGDYVTGLRHSLDYLLPVIGPSIDAMGDKAQGGKPARALGEATAFAVPLALGLRSAVTPAAEAAAGAKTAAPGAEEAAQKTVLDAGRKYNVRLTAADVSQRPGLQNVETALEKVPGAGMGALRKAQQSAVKSAAQGVQRTYMDKLIDAEPSALEDLTKAAKAGDARAGDILDKFEAAGNDPDRTTQASIGLADWTTRQTAKDLYDKVSALAKKHSLGDVPMEGTEKALNSSLDELEPAKLPNKETIRLLSDVKKSIGSKPGAAPEPSGVLDAAGEPVAPPKADAQAPNNGYDLIRQLHSDLGDRIRDYYQGNNALIGEKGVGHLERVQHAIEGDLSDYAGKSGVPEIQIAGATADQYYKTARVPFKNGQLAAAANSAEPDQVFQQFIKNGKGDRAQNFYNALDDRGKAAVRYNMINKAVQDATNNQSGVFSPQKFFTSTDKLQDAYGVFFKGADKAEIDGFRNLMAHTTRAGQFAENPPTGQRLIPYLVAGEGARMLGAGVPGAAAAAALVGGARALFTTEAGQGLLLKAANLKPGTAAMDSLWAGRLAPNLNKLAAGSGLTIASGAAKPPTPEKQAASSMNPNPLKLALGRNKAAVADRKIKLGQQ